MNPIDDSLLDKMKLFLDYSVRRQKVISSNIANIETPRYQSKSLEFEEIFRSELSGPDGIQASRPGHLQGRPKLLREPVVRTDATGSMGNDENNVNMDQQLTAMSENVLKFSVVSQLLHMKLHALRSAIKEGRI